MREGKWAWLIRILIGGGIGLLIMAAFYDPLFVGGFSAPPICEELIVALGRGGATAVIAVLCAALGGAAGIATLPFADDGRSLLLNSAVHFVVTSVLFLLLMVQFYGLWWEGLLLLEGMLALLYALIWLGRWIGWYMEVMQLRTLLGLDAGPSPLKWRETLPYLPFVLLLCDGLPLLLRWVERQIQSGFYEIPVLSALILPFVLFPVGGFFAGLSLGKRQGVCPLYPTACFLSCLPMVYLLYNGSALFHCFLVAVPALAGNVLGWMYRRAVPKKGRGAV